MAIKFGDGELNPVVEEILLKTKDAAENLGKRSAERLDISRKKIEALDTKSKLAKQYEKFGRLHYKAFLGGEIDPAEQEAIAAEISTLRDKLNELNEEIEVAKAEFNESMANMAQKAREVLKTEKNEPTDEEKQAFYADIFESDEDDDFVVEAKD